MRADHYTVGTVGYSSGTFTDADHGREIEVRIEPARQGVITGSLFGADGVTRIVGTVYIIDVASGANRYYSYTETGDYEATVSINGAGYRVEAYPAASNTPYATVTGNFTAAGERVTHNFTFPASVIQGVVTYRDGSPVPYPSVIVQGLTPQGTPATFYAQRSRADGSYLIAGVGVGAFSILAQDNNGLIGTAAGAITAIESPVNLDIVMLATGTVTGVLLDGTMPVPSNWITMTPAAPLAPTTTTYTDGNGAYSFAGVPVGSFTLNACRNNRCATATGTLTSENETVSVTVTLPPAAQVTGTVFGVDRVTPVEGAEVQLFGPDNYWNSTSTNAAGRFTFGELPDGNFRVTATQYPNAAVVTVTVLAGHLVDTVLRLGTAVMDQIVLVDDDGFEYDIDCSGRMMSGGNGSGEAWAYSYAYRLRLNSQSAGCQRVIGLQEGRRQAVIGPALSGGGGEGPDPLEFTRKIYVPEGGRFARYLEIIRNLTNEPQEVTVRLDGSLYAEEGILLPVTPGATGSRYAVTSGAGSSTLAVGHVFAGAGGQLPVASFQAGNSFFSYQWTVTLPPHGSAAFMHFTAQRGWDDVAGAEAQAIALSDVTDPEALTGLSELELGMIVNFVAPGGVVLSSGSISGQVQAVDGSAVAGAIVYALDDDSGRILARTTSSSTGAYRFDGMSVLYGIALVALHPNDPLNEVFNFVEITTPGEVHENVTLRFNR